MLDPDAAEFSVVVLRFRSALADCGLGRRNIPALLGIEPRKWEEFERSLCSRCLGAQAERRMRLFTELVLLISAARQGEGAALWLVSPDPSLAGEVPLRLLTREPSALPALVEWARQAVG